MNSLLVQFLQRPVWVIVVVVGRPKSLPWGSTENNGIAAPLWGLPKTWEDSRTPAHNGTVVPLHTMALLCHCVFSTDRFLTYVSTEKNEKELDPKSLPCGSIENTMVHNGTAELLWSLPKTWEDRWKTAQRLLWHTVAPLCHSTPLCVFYGPLPCSRTTHTLHMCHWEEWPVCQVLKGIDRTWEEVHQVSGKLSKKAKDKGLDTCYSATYMS